MLTRFARRLVPPRWRDAIERDLRDEAATRGRRGLSADAWTAGHLLRIGAAFRWRGSHGSTPPHRQQLLGRLRIDLRHAWRGLHSRPGASLGTALVLTIGVGLTALIFALVDPFLLRPLPYADPAPLVIMRIEASASGSPFDAATMAVGPGVPTLADWQRRTDLFQEVAAYGVLDRVRLDTPEGARALAIWTVSPNFVSFLAGRDQTPVLPASGSGRPVPVVVTPATARERLGLNAGGDATVRAEWRRERAETLAIVVPTLPAGFIFPATSLWLVADAVTPVEFGPVVWRSGSGRSWLTAVARVRPGISPDRVKAAIDPGLATSGLQVTVAPLHADLTAALRPLAWGALAVGLLIAIVCTANVMNLLVAHGLYRARDFATRRALGASRLDLLRLVVLELAVTAAGAAATGLLIANVGLAAVKHVMPPEYGALGVPIVSVRVVLFTLGLTGAIVAIGALPAWLSVRSASSASIARARQEEPHWARQWRFALTAGQTMVAVVLLVGAAFLSRSYASLWLQTTGYARDAMLVSVAYPASITSGEFRDAISSTLEALRRVPGVARAAAGVGVGPLLDGFAGGGGPTIRVGSQSFMLLPSRVTEDYFAVTGTPLLAGRAIEAGDRRWDAVVVNQALARRVLPDVPVDRVIGHSITVNGEPGRIVGLVQDAHQRALDIAPAPRLYTPFDTATGQRLSYVIRVSPGIPTPDAGVRRAVAGVHPNAIVEGVESVYGRLADSVRDRTFATLMVGIFAAAALGVSAAGVVAVVAFVAARRTREIAIRVAIGARPRDIRRLVVRDALLAGTVGGISGLIASRWLARAIESHLYSVTADDWLTPAVALTGAVGIAILAAWWPARRALAVEPTVALRLE